MEYHDNDEQDTDWSNEEVEEGQVAGRDPEEEQEETGESEEAWHQVQRIGSRYKCLTCGVTGNTKNQIDRHITEHYDEIDECIHAMNRCDKCSNQIKTGNQKEKHTTKIHVQNQMKCHICDNRFNSEQDFNHHMKETHTTYKQCDYFQEDCCEAVNCRYYHVKMQEGQHICYKCAKLFSSKRDMINHIIEKHSNVICHKFLRNKCNVRKCFFNHIIPSAPSVGRTSEQITQRIPTSQDFPNLPTIRPVVRSQEAAEPQILCPPVPKMSQQDQEHIVQITAQAVAQEMKNIMPQLMTLMKEILKTQ